jgi:succinyl-CoA synthetase alpha subunit
VWQCSSRGIGQTTCVGIGGDPVKGINFTEVVELMNNDPECDGIILIGEIGGNDEVMAGRWGEGQRQEADGRLHRGPDRTAGTPHGSRRRHHQRRRRHGREQVKALRECGISVADTPATLGETMAKALNV